MPQMIDIAANSIHAWYASCAPGQHLGLSHRVRLRRVPTPPARPYGPASAAGVRDGATRNAVQWMYRCGPTPGLSTRHRPRSTRHDGRTPAPAYGPPPRTAAPWAAGSTAWSATPARSRCRGHRQRPPCPAGARPAPRSHPARANALAGRSRHRSRLRRECCHVQGLRRGRSVSGSRPFGRRTDRCRSGPRRLRRTHDQSHTPRLRRPMTRVASAGAHHQRVD